MICGKMDTAFVEDIRRQIYDVKVNGVIPLGNGTDQQMGRWRS